MTRYSIAYWASVVLACVLAVLPYSWGWLDHRVDVVALDVVCACSWVACFVTTVCLARIVGRGRWWLAVTAPVALFPALEFLLMLVFWKLLGFAP